MTTSLPLCVPIAIAGCLLATRVEARPTFELEGQVAGQHQLVGWGLFPSTAGGPGLLAGVQLGRRVALLTGVTASVAGSQGVGGVAAGRSYDVTVPLELKLYLREPTGRAGQLVPLLRLGAGYGHSFTEWETQAAYRGDRLLGTLLVGLQYWATERIGFQMEGGATGSLSHSDHPHAGGRIWGAGFGWRGGVVLRL